MIGLSGFKKVANLISMGKIPDFSISNIERQITKEGLDFSEKETSSSPFYVVCHDIPNGKIY